MVQALFVASCLLSIVSWYTTFEGMRLYLSVWFSVLASIGCADRAGAGGLADRL